MTSRPLTQSLPPLTDPSVSLHSAAEQNASLARYQPHPQTLPLPHNVRRSRRWPRSGGDQPAVEACPQLLAWLGQSGGGGGAWEAGSLANARQLISNKGATRIDRWGIWGRSISSKQLSASDVDDITDRRNAISSLVLTAKACLKAIYSTYSILCDSFRILYHRKLLLRSFRFPLT